MNAKFLILALLAAGCTAYAAADIVPVAVCTEYYTNPVVGAIGANYNLASNGPGNIPVAFGTTGSEDLIVHFAYLSTEAQSITNPYGILFENYMSPGTQVIEQQPWVFYPGASAEFRGQAEYIQKTWFLFGNLGHLTPIGIKNRGVVLSPSPICKPAWEPSTALTYSQPGIYPGQYLGQVDSGPAARATFAISASSSSNVVISNLTYILNDTANASGTFNPNSIYGDIAISGSSHGSTAAEVQLTVNDKAVLSAMVPISY
jgi:hypothetical protein